MNSIPEALSKMKNDAKDLSHFHSRDRVEFFARESGRKFDRTPFARLRLQYTKGSGHEHAAAVHRNRPFAANGVNRSVAVTPGNPPHNCIRTEADARFRHSLLK